MCSIYLKTMLTDWSDNYNEYGVTLMWQWVGPKRFMWSQATPTPHPINHSGCSENIACQLLRPRDIRASSLHKNKTHNTKTYLGLSLSSLLCPHHLSLQEIGHWAMWTPCTSDCLLFQCWLVGPRLQWLSFRSPPRLWHFLAVEKALQHKWKFRRFIFYNNPRA